MMRRWFRNLSRDRSDAPMAPEAFRDLYLAYLRKKAPRCETEVRGELELKVKTEDGAIHGVYLDNAYQQYLGKPEERDDLIELYITSFLEVVNQEEKSIDPDRIVPIIKDRGWLEEIQASMEEGGGKGRELPDYLCDRYNSELAIFYAEDSERNIRYLTEDSLEGLGIDRADLPGLSRRNLRQLLGEIQVMGGEGIYLVSAGGDYEACLLLLDSIWDREKMPVDGEYVAAIPSRDLLIVTGSEQPDAIERLREVASQGAAEFSYPLSPVLFVRREGRFEVFEG